MLGSRRPSLTHTETLLVAPGAAPGGFVLAGGRWEAGTPTPAVLVQPTGLKEVGTVGAGHTFPAKTTPLRNREGRMNEFQLKSVGRQQEDL